MLYEQQEIGSSDASVTTASMDLELLQQHLVRHVPGVFSKSMIIMMKIILLNIMLRYQ
jgi:hypothetical protein